LTRKISIFIVISPGFAIFREFQTRGLIDNDNKIAPWFCGKKKRPQYKRPRLALPATCRASEGILS
jgi:hypothetical protein